MVLHCIWVVQFCNGRGHKESMADLCKSARKRVHSTDPEPQSVHATTSSIKHTLFVAEAGLKLRLSEIAVASALQYCHTFWQEMQADHYDYELVAMAALSLAVKVCEIPVKLSDVVNTCYRCIHRDKPPLEIGELYWQLKDSVAQYELILIRALHFKMHLDLPHSYLLHHLLALSYWTDLQKWEESHIVTTAWSLLQDSFHSTLNLQHSANKMAVAALYLATHCCKLPICSEGARHQWWEVMCPGVEEAQLQDIGCQIMDIVSLCSTSDPHTHTRDTIHTVSTPNKKKKV